MLQGEFVSRWSLLKMFQIHCPRQRPTSDGAKRRPVAERLGPERFIDSLVSRRTAL